MSPLHLLFAIASLFLQYALRFVVGSALMFGLLIALLKLYLTYAKGACICRGRLDGKTAVVTGGSAGIGLETARELARRGARVLLLCRDNDRAERARNIIISSTGNSNVHCRLIDLADLDSVRRCSYRLTATEPNIHLLVLNAGAAGLAKRTRGVDPVMQINHLGHFLLTNLLLDKLITSSPSRVVVVSSLAHYFADLNLDKLGEAQGGHWTRYANSKLCNVLFARALSVRVPPGVEVHAVHPGVVYTDIFRRLPEKPRRIILSIIKTLFKSASEGAQTSIHLCLAEDLGENGRYWADCRPARASALARDPEAAVRLWNESARLTGLSSPIDSSGSPRER